MNIALDIGNTNMKLGVFEDDRLTTHHIFTSVKGLAECIHHHRPEHLICASVNSYPDELTGAIAKTYPTIFLSHKTPLPISIRYETPETLGVDRIAAVAGATHLFPGENVLVIDMGTCITYDLVDSSSCYWGGAISPGFNMKLKALNTFTANLPLVSLIKETPLRGNNTRQSILSGVVNGTQAEITEIIRQYSDEFVNLKVILCGGDVGFFESYAKTHIFVTPDLVLIGLNRILQHNVQDRK